MSGLERNAPHGKVAHAGRFSAIQRVCRAGEASEHLHPALLTLTASVAIEWGMCSWLLRNMLMLSGDTWVWCGSEGRVWPRGSSATLDCVCAEAAAMQTCRQPPGARRSCWRLQPGWELNLRAAGVQISLAARLGRPGHVLASVQNGSLGLQPALGNLTRQTHLQLR